MNPDRKLIEKLTPRVLDFLKARKKESSGYGATPMLPATVEDTYHALRILSAIDINDDLDLRQDQALRDYLFRMEKTDWTGARTKFQVLSSCLLAGVPFDIHRTVKFIKRRLAETQNTDEYYYCERIAREIPGVANMLDLSEFDGLYNEWIWRVAYELWIILYHMNMVQGVLKFTPQNDFVSWLQSCQNCDGGFGFLPGSTSYVENCHTCLRALSLLDASPENPYACQAFVIACRTGNGGFARIDGATAFLDSTWHAIASLSLLDTIRIGD
ncbi:MAG: hypothetical protein JXA35_01320 [Deltaproteobacteria bacterium]|nr:hypothetical protein [Deltaproteobacteria bacterium]